MTGPVVPWTVEWRPEGIVVTVETPLSPVEAEQLAEALTRHAAHIPGHIASQAAPRPAPEPSVPLVPVHAYRGNAWELLCGGTIDGTTSGATDADEVTCGACLTILRGGPE